MLNIVLFLLLLMWLQTACLAWVQKLIFISRSYFWRGKKMRIWVIVVALSNVVVSYGFWSLLCQNFAKICQSTCVSVHPSNVKFSRPASYMFQGFSNGFFAWEWHKCLLLWQWITNIFTVMLLWMTNLRLLNIVYVALLYTVKQGYICNEMYDQ